MIVRGGYRAVRGAGITWNRRMWTCITKGSMRAPGRALLLFVQNGSRATEDPGLPRFIQMRSLLITWEAICLSGSVFGVCLFPISAFHRFVCVVWLPFAFRGVRGRFGRAPEGYAHFTSAKSMRCGSFAFFGKTRIAMSNDPVVSGVEAMR